MFGSFRIESVNKELLLFSLKYTLYTLKKNSYSISKPTQSEAILRLNYTAHSDLVMLKITRIFLYRPIVRLCACPEVKVECIKICR